MKYFVIAAAVCLLSSSCGVLGRPDGAGHDHSHSHDSGAAAAAPATGYAQPSTGYAQPSTGYSAASASGGSGYGAPATGYGAPSDSYGEPSGYSGYEDSGSSGYDQSYAAPTGYDTSYEASADTGLPNLSIIIIPLLIVAGLALLFPQTTQVAVRRKRDIEAESSNNSVVERIQDIYSSLVESEECMERVACEIGGLAQDVGVDKSLINTAQAFVPSKYSKYMKKFTTGKDCHKIKCGNFF